jgi:hypothetical protein
MASLVSGFENSNWRTQEERRAEKYSARLLIEADDSVAED